MLRRTRTKLLRLFIAISFCLVSLQTGDAAEAHHAMVASEGAEASQIGLDVIEHGGNAVDAAVAVALALGVTNSASCGIGGGGFMLIYWAKDHKLYALDYRETAPKAASADMYFRNGKPVEELARTGALAVAVPGELAGLDAALRRFGTMPFSSLVAPAVKLAREGFVLSPHMARDIAFSASQIVKDPGFRAQFFDAAGAPLKAGARVRAPGLAALMDGLGDQPVERFYHGATAAQIAAFIKASGGILTTDDLANYRPVWREPIHLRYRGYDLYTMPPPSSGGIVLEMFGMIAPGHTEGLGLNSPAYLAQLIEIMRQGFVDRDRYGDPAFVKVPVAELLSPAHLSEARQQALHHLTVPNIASARDHGTSNFCIVDKAGNVVDVTTTINTIFGAKIMVPEAGLILNDEMDDFAVAPGVPNAFKLVQSQTNAIAPGKRPLSSMSPLIALRGRAPAMVMGASGGPTIITGVLQVGLNILDFGLSPEAAVSAPRIHEQSQPPTVFTEAAMPATTIGALRQMGYPIKVVPELGAVSAIRITPGMLDGAFDPSKGGGAVGN